jgi:hypothetical protein
MVLHQIDFGDFLMIAARSVILVKFIPIVSSMIMVIHTLNSHHCRPGCSVVILYNTVVGTRVDVD